MLADLLLTREFETDQEAQMDVSRRRKQTDQEGEYGDPVSPSLYQVGIGRQGLHHNLLQSPRGDGDPGG